MSNSEHLVFETDGTRYDLVLVDDPYGGVLVVWPVTGYLWRWFPGNRMATLTTNANPYDKENIFKFLERGDR